MTVNGLDTSLRAFARRRPFKHFLLEFFSGDRIVVRHPEAVLIRPDVVVFTSPAGAYHLFESDSVCQLLDLPAA